MCTQRGQAQSAERSREREKKTWGMSMSARARVFIAEYLSYIIEVHGAHHYQCTLTRTQERSMARQVTQSVSV